MAFKGRRGLGPGTLGLLLLLPMTVACSTDSSGEKTTGTDTAFGSGSEEPGKYEQTWPKAYGRTRCNEWLNQMDPHERFVAAADMLVGARSEDGGDDLPEDALVEEFASGLDNVCPVTPGGSLAETAAGLYLTERGRFRP